MSIIDDNITYSLNFEDTISYNVIRHALALDYRIAWVSFKEALATKQLMPDWVLKKSHFDDDRFIQNIINTRHRDDRDLGASTHQLTVFSTHSFGTFTEKVFVNQQKTLA